VTADNRLTGPIVLAASNAAIAAKSYVDMLGNDHHFWVGMAG
jgi:hypothetical protein